MQELDVVLNESTWEAGCNVLGCFNFFQHLTQFEKSRSFSGLHGVKGRWDIVLCKRTTQIVTKDELAQT